MQKSIWSRYFAFTLSLSKPHPIDFEVSFVWWHHARSCQASQIAHISFDEFTEYCEWIITRFWFFSLNRIHFGLSELQLIKKQDSNVVFFRIRISNRFQDFIVNRNIWIDKNFILILRRTEFGFFWSDIG